MLVLTRKEGEKIRIGDDIVISVVRVNGDKVRIGIEAPTSMTILRDELKAKERPIIMEVGTIPFSAPLAQKLEAVRCP